MAQQRFFEVNFTTGQRTFEKAHSAKDVLTKYGAIYDGRAKAGESYPTKDYRHLKYKPITREYYEAALAVTPTEVTEALKFTFGADSPNIPAEGRRSNSMYGTYRRSGCC